MEPPRRNHHIPSEILSYIFSKLPLEDIIRCSCVSTYWYQSAKHVHLPSHNLHCIKSEILDILVLNNTLCFGWTGFNDNMHLISSHKRGIDDGKCKHKEISVRNNFQGSVVGSCNGLLCIAHLCGKPHAIFNPFTQDTVILPELQLSSTRLRRCAHSYGFGFDVNSKKYKVVVAYQSNNNVGVTGDIITVGEGSWKRLFFPEELRNLPFDTLRPATYLNRSFQWVLGREHHWGSIHHAYRLIGILTLDIDTEMISITRFSTFMDLATPRVCVFNIGDSLALVGDEISSYYQSVGEDNRQPPQTQIWKLLGANADGSCNYQLTYLSLGAKYRRLFGDKAYPLPLGALSNSNFLFRVTKFDPYSEHFVMYDIENDDGSLLEVPSEVPKSWEAIIFQPSLVSPPF